MPLTLKVFPSSAKSVLTNVDLVDFDFADANSKLFADNANRLAKKFLKARKNVTVYVDFDPMIYDPTDKASLLPLTLRTREAVDKDPNDPRGLRWRHLTKHRVVTSTVTAHMITRGNLTQPFPITVTTTCAPNGMGSNENDREFFFRDDAAINSKYMAMMQLTYQRCLHVQIRQWTRCLIIPPIGLGLYIKTLSDSQKIAAMRANYLALRKAIESIDPTKTGGLKEIICVAPNKQGKNHFLPVALEIFSGYKHSIPISFVPADALELAQKLTEKNYLVGVINAGSDRTIGGGYTSIHSAKLPPMEETLCQATDLVYAQAIDIGSGNYKGEQFPPHLLCDKSLIQTVQGRNDEAKESKDDDQLISPFARGEYKDEEQFHKKQFACDIKQWLKNPIFQNHKIFIFPIPDKNIVKVSFKTEDEATLFTIKLESVGIRSKMQLGTPKKVHKENIYFIVVLTQPDVTELLKHVSRNNQQDQFIPALSLVSANLPVVNKRSEYEKFKESYTEALIQEKSVCFFGRFRRSNMDFNKYKNIEQVQEYVGAHPKSRSAEILNPKR